MSAEQSIFSANFQAYYTYKEYVHIRSTGLGKLSTSQKSLTNDFVLIYNAVRLYTSTQGIVLTSKGTQTAPPIGPAVQSS